MALLLRQESRNSAVSFSYSVVYNSRVTDLLLQTKFFKPTLRPSYITRPQLIAQLNAGLGIGARGFAARLMLVSAPAGFGKTTIVSAWLAQLTNLDLQYSGENVAWLSLDENDNDPVRFLTYLIAAIQTAVSDNGRSAIQLLQSPQPPTAETILTVLINDINQNDRPIILVLDDYHLITAPAVHEALAFLLDHLPPSLHLLITTRSDPPLPLSRLRARSQIVEIRTDQLRFTFDETGRFLNQVMGLTLSDEQTAALEQRTEGWIAGLQLAALSLKDHVDQEERIAAFAGSHHFIIDYLTEEVLSQQPGSVREFLLSTSILERICGPLANALMQSTTGQEKLEYLERNNLFLIPLDDERRWFRYHRLFAGVLRQRLQQEQPARLPEFHRRASAWHEHKGLWVESVNHALAAQDYDQASRLIEQISMKMWQQGAVTTLQSWLAELPPGLRRARPQLCLAQAWSALAAGQLDMVDSSILEAEEAMIPLIEEEAKPLRAQIDAIRSTIAGYREDNAKAIVLAHQAIEHLPEEDHFLRGHLTYNLGRAYLSQGDLSTARQKLQEAAALSLNAGNLSTVGFALAALGAEMETQGQLREAAVCYREVIQAIQKNGRPLPIVAASGAYVRLSRVLYEWNQLDESLQYIKQGIELSHQNSGAMLIGSLVMVNILRAHNDLSGAFESLRDAETAARDNAMPKAVLRYVEAVRAQLWLDQSNMAAATQWATDYERDLKFPTGGDWPDLRQLSPIYDYEYLTLIRIRIAQAHWDETLKMLRRLQPIVEAGARKGSLIELLVLRALALQAQTNSVESIAALENALSLAEPEGYIRLLVNEGETLRKLLHEYRSQLLAQQGNEPDDRSRRLLAYTNTLLAAFPLPGTKEAPRLDPLFDPLSERELEVLTLIATGASNRDIADTLFLAVPTIKKHVSNILSKLNATSRTQAVAEARTLGLL